MAESELKDVEEVHQPESVVPCVLKPNEVDPEITEISDLLRQHEAKPRPHAVLHLDGKLGDDEEKEGEEGDAADEKGGGAVSKANKKQGRVRPQMELIKQWRGVDDVRNADAITQKYFDKLGYSQPPTEFGERTVDEYDRVHDLVEFGANNYHTDKEGMMSWGKRVMGGGGQTALTNESEEPIDKPLEIPRNSAGAIELDGWKGCWEQETIEMDGKVAEAAVKATNPKLVGHKACVGSILEADLQRKGRMKDNDDRRKKMEKEITDRIMKEQRTMEEEYKEAQKKAATGQGEPPKALPEPAILEEKRKEMFNSRAQYKSIDTWEMLRWRNGEMEAERERPAEELQSLSSMLNMQSSS